MQLLPGGMPSRPPAKSGSRKTVSVPGLASCVISTSWSLALTCPPAMTSCISVTTIGMMVKGLPTQVASAIMPTFSTCASIWPKPAISATLPASLGTRMPAGRSIGLTTSPTRSVNWCSVPEVPARTMVLSRSA
ncbi:hypothetical protein D9M69_607020 [compost metagenome]